MENKQWILKKRPQGKPTTDTWDLKTSKIVEPNDGEVLLEHLYISIDPAMRGWMNAGKSYIEPVEIGDVMRAGMVGKILESKHDGFKKGDYVSGWGGVQQFSVSDGSKLQKIDKNLASLPTFLGVLGMTGMTAYFGLLEVGKLNKGDTVLVSGAAGAVGSVVGQVAKLKGAKVIGIAGGKEKCQILTEEYGFDEAVDYKDGNFIKNLRATCREGIDIYFDNVGGEILDAALTLLNRHARVVICGAISQYNASSKIKGPTNYLSLLVNRATMQGMVVFDYKDRYQEAAKDMARWIKDGKLKTRETIVSGIEKFPEAFDKLFTGDKLGKLVLKVK